jgi:hypothetical protein
MMAVRSGAAGSEWVLATMSLTGDAGAQTYNSIDADLPTGGEANRKPTSALIANGLVLVSLTATEATGNALSNNLHSHGAKDPADHGLTTLAPITLATAVAGTVIGEETVIRVTLPNRTATPAIQTKLTIMNGDGCQVQPARFGDKHVSLFLGETRKVTVRHPTTRAKATRMTLGGWNVTPTMEKER